MKPTRNTIRDDRYTTRLAAGVCAAAAVLAGAGFALQPGAAGAATPRADLTVSQISGSGSLVPGSRIAVTATTKNAGARSASSSVTRLYLSRDGRRSADDRRVASVSIPRLVRGAAARRTLRFTVSDTTPLRGRVLVCVDVTRRVPESSELNNCRTTPDGDRDGFANFGDCAPRNRAIHPGVNDRPDVPAMRDNNCDRIDGTARRAVFVSSTGDDDDPGTRARPKATFARAVEAAVSQRKDVYAARGTYGEALLVRDGVSVYGGYDSSWRRSLTSTTRLAGGSYGADIAAAYAGETPNSTGPITAATRLQLLRLEPTAPTGQGGSSYGLVARNVPGLTVERVVATAAPGRAGDKGSDGADGSTGGDGEPGGAFGNCINGGQPGAGGGWGGGSGGRGAYGGISNPGQPGSQGLLSSPGDSDGKAGGPGGFGADPGNNTGGRGISGDSGLPGADGAGGQGGRGAFGVWIGDDGDDGQHGRDGHGGGGGGGGGSQGGYVFGGGGGGGGAGGGGGRSGRGGEAGGGSFGFYFAGESGLVKDSIAAASDGGAGARGGEGGYLGFPGQGAIGTTCGVGGTGGKGGTGGFGGLGGDGGGGAGGPSAAFYGVDASKTPGSTARHAVGGAGGSGPGAPGSDGAAGDYLGGGMP